MRKIIWCCWFQGENQAPELVRRCIESWRYHNPDWDVRCLDRHTIRHYVQLSRFVDLERQQVTPASLSDILRLALLHEYGGVWVDATTLCMRPLNDWLPSRMKSGFFVFEKPGPNRPISSWFIAADLGNPILEEMTLKMAQYWKERTCADAYFWLHHLFGQILEENPTVQKQIEECNFLPADLPHSALHAGLHKPALQALPNVDLNAPFFKLTYRLNPETLRPDSLVNVLLGTTTPLAKRDLQAIQPNRPTAPKDVASLKVSTENIGDHIQILAAYQMLKRIGLKPNIHIDRDNEINLAPQLAEKKERLPLLINGWFKQNRTEWPPNSAFDPVYLGFHIRLFQCPELVSPAALDHYRDHEPIGCRDSYTMTLLRHHGIEAYISHCLSLMFPRRLPDPKNQTEIIVASRDERLADTVRELRGPVTSLLHYTGDQDFERNLQTAQEALARYRDRAKLIVTSLLHCALPAIAMGIPVLVVYPQNTDKGHKSDRERFSGLETLIPLLEFDQLADANWGGYQPDVGDIKLGLLDRFLSATSKWNPPGPKPTDPSASPESLPIR